MPAIPQQNPVIQAQDLEQPGMTAQEAQNIANMDNPIDQNIGNILVQDRIVSPEGLVTKLEVEENKMATSIPNNGNSADIANALQQMSSEDIRNILASMNAPQPSNDDFKKMQQEAPKDSEGLLSWISNNWKGIAAGAALAIAILFIKSKFFDDDSDEVGIAAAAMHLFS